MMMIQHLETLRRDFSIITSITIYLDKIDG